MKSIKIHRARLSKGYIPPSYKEGARQFMLLAGNAYLKGAEKLDSVHMQNPENLCRALKDHEEGKYRLIILFRHSDKADAPALMHGVNKLSLTEGKKLGIRYKKRPHAAFLYGKDVPNWAGALAAWIFPRLGNIPVINRGLCRESIDDIKKTLKENQYPLALAPEGQVTYHAHHCFDLEPGIMHMASWAAEHGPVRLLPVALAYDYGKNRMKVLCETRKQWMLLTGESLVECTDPYAFCMDLTGKTLDLLENAYPGTLPYNSLDERIQSLTESILSRGESLLKIRKSGTVLDRIFKLRYKGVECRYPELRDPESLTPWDKKQSDYDCIKASLYIRDSQIADVLEYVHSSYIPETGLSNRHCEYALNILDLANRFMGGDIGSRSSFHLRRAIILPGSTIDPLANSENHGKKEHHRIVLQSIKETMIQLSLEIEDSLV